MIAHDCVQGSDEWLQLRLGIPTASEFDRIVTPAKLAPAAAATKYLHVKLAEWMYGAPLEAFVSPWMERGQALEAEAVRYYEMERDCQTQAVGLVTTDDGMIGASPDRLVGQARCQRCEVHPGLMADDSDLPCGNPECHGGIIGNGILEQKCPALETHVGYMLDPASLVAEYRLQVQGQLWVCEREWCDMQSYYPGFSSVITRVQRDEKVIAALALHVPAFVATMLECRAKLCQMYGDLRRERLGEIKAAEHLADRRAAFDEFMGSQIGGVA
jgi:YqaJ-like viral recombinase domain